MTDRPASASGAPAGAPDSIPPRRPLETGVLAPARGRANPWAMAALFLWAVLFRLIYVRQISSSPLFSSPVLDPLYHDQWARALAAGDWWGKEAFFRAPFYPYFLGLVYRLFGHSYLLPRLIQAGLGSLTCVLVYVVGRRVFGERAGILAGAVSGAYWMLIYFDGELLINVFENLFNVLFLWLLLRAAEAARARSWLLAGVALGLSAVSRPTALAVGGAAVVWMAWILRRRLWRPLGAYALGAVLVIAPVAVRNTVVSGDFVPIAWQGGLNFYLGNHPGADGWSATAPELPRDWWGGYERQIQIAEEARGRKLRPSEISDYWMERGLAFLRTQPGEFARLWLRKLGIFWSSYEYGNNQVVYFFRRYAPLLSWPLPGFGLVGPLGLAGMLLLTRGRARALLTLFVVVTMLTIVSFFVCDKLRLPVVPVLAIWASAFAVWWIDGLRRGRMGAALGSLLVVGALAVVVNVDYQHIPKPNHAIMHAMVGGVYLQQGKMAEAEREFRECVKISPQFPKAHLNLGAILSQRGQMEEAEAEYRLEMEQSGEDPMLLSNLASLLQVQGKYDEAIALDRRALALGAKDPQVRYNLGLCLVRVGSLHEAEQVFRQVLAEVPGHVEALNNLGVVAAELGRYDEAIALWRQALSLDPDFARARENIESALRDRARGGVSSR